MRPELQKPVGKKKVLKTAIDLAERIFLLHENGRKYTEELKQLSATVGRTISSGEACGAFGSIDADQWAKILLQNHETIPTDLPREELLELFQCLIEAKGTESQQSLWMSVLEVNTADPGVSDLIYWPNEYFGDDNLHREMTAEEMLETAMKTGAPHRAAAQGILTPSASESRRKSKKKS